MSGSYRSPFWDNRARSLADHYLCHKQWEYVTCSESLRGWMNARDCWLMGWEAADQLCRAAKAPSVSLQMHLHYSLRHQTFISTDTDPLPYDAHQTFITSWTWSLLPLSAFLLYQIYPISMKWSLLHSCTFKSDERNSTYHINTFSGLGRLKPKIFAQVTTTNSTYKYKSGFLLPMHCSH